MTPIEQKISTLVAGQFPSFYHEDGPNFIAFVNAYYEWLEQNFQLLDLDDPTNFNVNDKIRQGDVTGTIFAVERNRILVLVDQFDTFKCFNVCSELIPITSSSGGKTLVRRGGTTRRLGSLFLSRNLLRLRDIDRTIDLFVVKFKEKYLKNIEFDTRTNKRLLVKNSLDLYRSKGTRRSIDLFFRLIYGVRADVYYPGDDLFKLSDGEWFRPQYIEINSNSVERAISLVGRQITGVDSGATAFVERYVKRKIKDNFIHLLYVSNVAGQFKVTETLRADAIFPDSPVVLGSLVDVDIVDGSANFNVGDSVILESQFGSNAVGRVSAVARGSGEVRFSLIESGWGFSPNIGNAQPLPSQTFLSDNSLVIKNVEPGACVANIRVTAGGSGYSNTDFVRVMSTIAPAIGAVTTDNSGAITDVRLLSRGSLLYPNRVIPTVEIKDSSGNFSTGVGATFDISYRYPQSYLRFLENLQQRLQRVMYGTEIGIGDFAPGSIVNISNIGMGVVIDVDIEQTNVVISTSDNIIINPGDTIFLEDGTGIEKFITVDSVTHDITTGKVIDVADTATLTISSLTGVINPGDIIVQRSAEDGIYCSARVVSTAGLLTTKGTITVTQIDGTFRPQQPIAVFGQPVTATLDSVEITFHLAETSGTFVTSAPFISTSMTAISGQVVGKSSGQGAQYKIAEISQTEFARVNVDFLNNPDLLNCPLNDTYTFFTANSSVNSQSVVFGGLQFVEIPLGEINILGGINPGTGYGSSPIARPFQPGVQPLNKRDFVVNYTGNVSQFFRDEIVFQDNIIPVVRFTVADSSLVRRGERIYVVNTANETVFEGTVSDLSGTDTIDVTNFEGTIPSTGTLTIKSRISSFEQTIVSRSTFTRTETARAYVKDVRDNTLLLKRLQQNDLFRVGGSIVGSRSGAIATIISIEQDRTTREIGFNATVDTSSSIATGVIKNIEILDSGFGFNTLKQGTFITPDRSKSGTFNVITGGVGTAAGEYRNNKGFLSDLSKIHDGDYYQEYSYDIISRLPLDKYSMMFKKVMHTAGTRFFGSVFIDSIGEIATQPAPTPIALALSGNASSEDISSITVGPSPYAITDRTDIDVEDRGNIVIEIRE